MGTLPSRSTPSMASHMQGMKIKDRSEKGLMVRLGTLIDAVQNAQRGHANAGAGLDRRSIALNGKRPPLVYGETENVFNGASVTIDPIRSAAGLSTYEIQIDEDPNFSNPTTKVAFNKNIIFKGLTRGVTYNLRVRGITKGGQAGPWNILDPVLTTVSAGETTADIDGYVENEIRSSKDFNFIYSNEKVFAIASFGLTNADNTALPVGDEGAQDWGTFTVTINALENGVDTVPSAIYADRYLVSPALTEDTSGVDYSLDELALQGQVIRYWPIMMFPVFNMNDFLDVLDPGALNYPNPYPVPFLLSFGTTLDNWPVFQEPPAVWIKFGSLS